MDCLTRPSPTPIGWPGTPACPSPGCSATRRGSGPARYPPDPSRRPGGRGTAPLEFERSPSVDSHDPISRWGRASAGPGVVGRPLPSFFGTSTSDAQARGATAGASADWPRTRPAGPRKHSAGRCQEDPVQSPEPWSAGLTPKDLELMSEHQDLDILGRVHSGRAASKAEQPAQHEVEKSEEHGSGLL